VWLPQGEGPFPLVLVNHGDHAMQDFSDGGYDYLATSPVQEGYIVAVLDNNFLNRSWSDLLLTQYLTGPGDIRTRATLTVEHLRAFAEWNREPGTPLFNKVDLDKVAVVGHGEAVRNRNR
jgi:predicted dienelactone hydrolase